MRELLLVALGGAVGSVARALTTAYAVRWFGLGWPWGTATVNLVGSFAFGVIVGTTAHRGGVTPGERALLLSGLLGGFTTFSAFSFETVDLMMQGLPGRAVTNVVAQVVMGALALWAGLLLAARG